MISIDQLRSLADPLRSYRFLVILPQIKNEEVTDLVVDVPSIPFPTLEQIAVAEGSKEVYFPGHVSQSPLSIKFFAGIDGKVFKYHQEWRSLIIAESGKRNYPSTYKRDILIRLLNGRHHTAVELRARGCWPINPAPLSLAAESSDMVDYSIDFSVDDVALRVNEGALFPVDDPSNSGAGSILQRISEIGQRFEQGRRDAAQRTNEFVARAETVRRQIDNITSIPRRVSEESRSNSSNTWDRIRDLTRGPRI
jgi:hypothetical protein